MANTHLRIGAPGDLFVQPLVQAFGSPTTSEHLKSPAPAGLFVGSTGIITRHLIDRVLDTGFIGTIDYAQNSSDFSILPFAVSSEGESGIVQLCVNSDLRSITSVAIGEGSTTDVVLAKIILSERFDQEPSYIPVIGTIEEMLQKADAALVSGDRALTAQWSGPRLDLVDEWGDMTELPFVHLLCCNRNDQDDRNRIKRLKPSLKGGKESFQQLVSAFASRYHLSTERTEEYLSHLNFELGERERDAISEFFHYAFYLGVIPDIPDIRIQGEHSGS